MASLDDKFDDLTITYMVEGDENVSDKKRTQVNQELTNESIERNYKFFTSSNSSSKGKILGLMAIVLLLTGAFAISFKLKFTNVSTNNTSASDCNQFQVRVEQNGHYVCRDCGVWEYGDLKLCEENSLSGRCRKTESGCYAFVFED